MENSIGIDLKNKNILSHQKKTKLLNFNPDGGDEIGCFYNHEKGTIWFTHNTE